MPAAGFTDRVIVDGVSVPASFTFKTKTATGRDSFVVVACGQVAKRDEVTAALLTALSIWVVASGGPDLAAAMADKVADLLRDEIAGRIPTIQGPATRQ